MGTIGRALNEFWETSVSPMALCAQAVRDSKAGPGVLLGTIERNNYFSWLFVHRLFVTQKAAPLARMMVDLSAYPRSSERTGWLAPTVGSIEFLQHLVQVGPM